MKVCVNCKKEFPCWILVEGKRKSLQKRKFCLECSPYGKHNTLSLERFLKQKIKTVPEKQICTRCKLDLPINFFGVHVRKRNAKLQIFAYCKKCDSNRFRKRKRDIKEKAVEYKGGKCENCGYCKSLRSLHFHHKNPKEKDFTIAHMLKMDFEVLKRELDKCILICANCHGEVHEELDNAELV